MHGLIEVAILELLRVRSPTVREGLFRYVPSLTVGLLRQPYASRS